MKTHPEPEQLSAYLDGEVEAAERAQIEAHLPTCAECSATVAALKATVAELRELPSPTPSAQDSWALRTAVTRARKRPAQRYQRWVVAAGSVAAVAIAIVVIIQPGGSGKNTTLSQKGAAENLATGSDVASLINIDPSNFNEDSARDLIAVGENKTIPAPQAAVASGSADSRGSTVSGGSTTTDSYAADVARFLPNIQRCESELFAGDQTPRTPLRYIVARFKNVPAFLLLYSVPSGSTTKIELWVVQRKDCFPRYVVPAQ